MTDLILIRGLPGSGKTTLAKKFAAMGYAHLEADIWRERYRNGVYDPKDNEEAHGWCLDLAEVSLRAGANVVVANIFTEHWMMLPYIDMAKQLPDVDITVIKCEGEYENVHGVPEEKVEHHRRRWHNWPLV